ncbi:hypothetical protein [Streptomyces sp. NPDC101455]|uniref:hypothetical protein n=1 Tax=Streptomyces sp. NPDC101455 TaxID=3366142 RepID=UPI00382EB953
MLGWLKPNRTRQERALAMHAQMAMATRPPYAATASPREDPDSLVGEAVFHSGPVHEVLMKLAYGIAPQRPLKEAAEDALAAMSAVVVLRPSWIAYCDARFGLNPEATDAFSETNRQWVDGDTARAWPRFAQAKPAVITATERIAELRSSLVEFCGYEFKEWVGQTA